MTGEAVRRTIKRFNLHGMTSLADQHRGGRPRRITDRCVALLKEAVQTLPRDLGYMKRSALNNYFYGDVESLESAVHEAFTNIQQHPETALSLAYKTSTNLRQTA
jgi:hypothetical protein